MQWYPWFEGDYLRDTLHLTWLEDLAYRRLLDLCYRNGGYVSSDTKVLFRQVRATEPDQQKAVENVLAEFFFSRGRVKVNRRASKELVKVKAFHEARVRGGKHRHKHTNNNSAQLQLSSSSAVVPTSTSTLKNKTPLPPTRVGVSHNHFVHVERYGEVVEVQLGKHRRLPNLEATTGMRAEDLAQHLTNKGFPAKVKA